MNPITVLYFWILNQRIYYWEQHTQQKFGLPVISRVPIILSNETIFGFLKEEIRNHLYYWMWRHDIGTADINKKDLQNTS